MDTTPAVGTVSGAESIAVVRSEERARTGVERVVAKRVVVGKRIVTEERTVTVTVRREELVFSEEAVGADSQVVDTPAERADGYGEAEIEFVLSEEEPVVSVRTVPRERIRVFRETHTVEEHVDLALAREEIEMDGPKRGSAGVG